MSVMAPVEITIIEIDLKLAVSQCRRHDLAPGQLALLHSGSGFFAAFAA
jgi:hypothetical protein